MAKKTKKKPHSALQAFSARLREARQLHQLTQVDLAKKAGISVAYVSLLERAGRNPPTTLVWDLAVVLKTTPSFLLPMAEF